MRFPVCLASLGLVFLTACGGSSTSNGPTPSRPMPEPDGFEDRAEDLLSLQGNLPSAGTVYSVMPTAGRANFKGAAGIVIDPIAVSDDDDIVMIGDAELTVRFANNNPVQGRINNIQGARGGATSRPVRAFDVSGQLKIGSVASQIGDDRQEPGIDAQANEFLTSIRGNLTIPGEAYEIEGTLFGQFLGTRVNNPNTDIPMKGLLAAGEIMALDSDGDDSTALIAIAAENTDG